MLLTIRLLVVVVMVVGVVIVVVVVAVVVDVLYIQPFLSRDVTILDIDQRRLNGC